MAIVYLQFPPGIAPAFNPLRLVVQTPKARYAQLGKDLLAATTDEERNRIVQELTRLTPNKDQQTLDPITLRVVIGNNTANRTVLIDREPDAEGKAVIDLSYIMRHAFKNDLHAPYTYTEYDYDLIARYNIEDTGGDAPAFLGTVVNAVRQLGHDDGSGITGFGPLTQTPMVRYAGYPLAVTFQQIPYTGNIASLRTGNEIWTNHLPTPVGNVYVAGKGKDFDQLTITRADGTIVGDYRIETGCVPDRPFFVRWINTRGGWDYHMFERREERSETSDISNIQRVAADPNDTQTTVSISAVETIIVGEGLLDRDAYLILAALARSPRIEWYNEEVKAWQVVVLAEDFSSSWNSRNAYGSVEFTFSLPRILTQF